MYSWSVIEGCGSEIRLQRYDFFKKYARPFSQIFKRRKVQRYDFLRDMQGVREIIRSNRIKIVHRGSVCHCYPLTESTNLSIKTQLGQPFSGRHNYRLCTIYVPPIALPLPYHSPPLYHIYTTFIPLLKVPFLSALPIQNTPPYPITLSLHFLHSGQEKNWGFNELYMAFNGGQKENLTIN